MALPLSSLTPIPTCYATVSIGTPSTPLPSKLSAIASAGFTGIELGFPDLLSFASTHHSRTISAQDFPSLCTAAHEIQSLCRTHALKVVMLQPFSNFEGWAPGSPERADAFTRARGWIDIMEALGTEMLQVGSTDTPSASGDKDVLAADLRELADLLAEKGFRLAYENWCWATHAPSWKDVWEIVQKVDRPSIGLCLDTFQTAGGEWGDPTTSSGLLETPSSREALWVHFKKSLYHLAHTVPKDKIYILQISDAYKPLKPMSAEADEQGLRVRGRWSMGMRPMQFDGGYLPVVDVARAVLETGFRGWFSMEVFDGGPGGEDNEWRDMEGYAKKAMRAHERLLRECVECSVEVSELPM